MSEHPELKQDPEYALSISHGVGNHPKDMDWITKNIPCQAACPADTDIPGYLEAIAKGNFEEAYRLNLRDNVFPAVLGRVCTRPCEPACRHGWEGLGESVAICFAKRSADDFMNRKEPMVLPPLFDPTHKTIAVVGAGPAGLTVSRQLTLYGHQVTLYDKKPFAGGNMMDAIPDFRLPKSIVQREVDQVLATGVHFLPNQEIQDLKALRSKVDALVLALGTHTPYLPSLPGVKKTGVEHGLGFLNRLNTTGDAPDWTGKKVVVIGGGFTAVDCARMARRLGAQPTLYYRRGPEHMYITKVELDAFAQEGVSYTFFATPVRFSGEEQVASVTFVKTQVVDGELITIPGSEFEVQADIVLLGTGQVKTEAFPVDETDGYFLVGDVATGATSLIDAIGHAKQEALRIDEALMGIKRIRPAILVEDVPQHVTGRTREMDQRPVHVMPELPTEKRRLRDEVELGLSSANAKKEAERCYLCNYKFEIDNDLCIYCDRCLKVMPVDDCIVRVNALIYDEQDRITGYFEAEGVQDYNLLYLNQEQCIRCGACVEVCPVDCITLQKVTKIEQPIKE